MPRYLAFSNGRLLVSFAWRYNLCDLYRPHMDQENHTKGDFLRWGVRCGRNFSGTSDPEWEKEIRGRERLCDSRVLENVTR